MVLMAHLWGSCCAAGRTQSRGLLSFSHCSASEEGGWGYTRSWEEGAEPGQLTPAGRGMSRTIRCCAEQESWGGWLGVALLLLGLGIDQ